MITWFQIAYIGASMIASGKQNVKHPTPIETGDNEREFCAGLEAFEEIEHG